MDVFDGLPDPIIVDILNKVGDVRTILRCSSLSKRFNSLAPQSESLILRLDHSESDSPNIFRSLFNSFHGLLSLFSKPTKPIPTPALSPSLPSKILSHFDKIRSLDVELPRGDVKLEKGAAVKWKAEFGKTLKSCVVVTFRSAATVSPPVAVDGESDAEFVNGLKTRVVCTINSLMAASTRHYLMSEVVKEHEEMESLVIRDVEGEGMVVMDAEGLREFRSTRGEDEEERVVRNRRSVVPSVKMSMRHAPSLKLKSSGVCLESATLVIVRPSGVEYDVGDDAELATEAFAGNCMYGEAVVALLKCKKTALEMNSF
ncbi:PREDICTED: F-box protein At1g22220-like [Camelina sativa]|uniref:F-box protein At1g22220-like n=1 Tax=Camelina sativa TaxID=90675 RepID=A0ABM0YBV8_CAMSA|nr:PREDICTED: F-box protein At1g22220-like [Camelina sativa]